MNFEMAVLSALGAIIFLLIIIAHHIINILGELEKKNNKLDIKQ